jgi:hypothetical protein
MTNFKTYPFSFVLCLSLIACNNETAKETETRDSTTVDHSIRVDTNSNLSNDSTSQPGGHEGAPGNSGEEFHKVLTYKNYSFTINAKGKGSLQQLSLQPSGLSADNRKIEMEADPLSGALIEDLNSDGFPEVLIFTQSAGSGSYGKVLAYSVNNGKSMSRVTFPETGENPRIKQGYMGHDKFSVVNNQLTQTFPIYSNEDANSQPNGKKRVVTYKLINGETSRVFAVEKVEEVN